MTMLGSFAAETGAFLIYSSNACNFRISGRFAQHCWNYYPPFARISRSAENPREIASRSGRRIIFARIMPVTTVPTGCTRRTIQAKYTLTCRRSVRSVSMRALHTKRGMMSRNAQVPFHDLLPLDAAKYMQIVSDTRAEPGGCMHLSRTSFHHSVAGEGGSDTSALSPACAQMRLASLRVSRQGSISHATA